MQCIWTSTSNVLRRQLWRTCSPSTSFPKLTWYGRPTLAQRKYRANGQPTIKTRALSSAARAFVSTAIRDSSIPPSPYTVPEHLSKTVEDTTWSKDTHSPAQLSRFAAQAVRIACEGPSTREAFLILDSLQKCAVHYRKRSHPWPPPKNVAIDFGMVVSRRLAVHSLLHGLVRRGMTKKAGDIARRITLHDPAVRLSDRTLRYLSTALCQTDALALRDKDFHSQIQDAKSDFGDYLSEPKVVCEKKVQLPCTRIAINLFFAAKQYRKQRAKQMFQQLIDACLLQGEILVVSFLIAFLLKQLQARTSDTSASGDSFSQKNTDIPAVNPSPSLRFREVFLARTLSYITPVLAGEILPDPHAIRPSHEEAAQALAFLTGMLLNDLLPHSQADALVKALVLFRPSSSVQVWTLQKGKKEKWERRDAREYFDEALNHLLHQVVRSDYGRYGMNVCRARVETYNSLINYSLRRRTAPSMAERIIKRMKERGDYVAPNITTFNIVLRASRILRRHDVAQTVLKALRDRPENSGHAIMFEEYVQRRELIIDQKTKEAPATGEHSLTTNKKKSPSDTCKASSSTERLAAGNSLSNLFVPTEVMVKLSPVVQRVFLEETDPDSLSSAETPLPADGDTLAAYIDYLTASGRPEVVVELVKLLLPELKGRMYPREGREDRRLAYETTRFNFRIVRLRAIGLGPLFFTSALNALVKAGKTGLAEKTWQLAKSAEGCSWNPQYSVQPWILPCAAYTIMMQCYAAEARKARRWFHQPSMPPSNALRLGWGTQAIEKRRKARQSVSLLDMSWDMGELVFRSRHFSEENYRIMLVSYLEEGGDMPNRRTIQLPVADERFFNAALSLFGHHPLFYIPARRTMSRYRSRRLERRQIDYFMKRGHVRFPQDRRLISVLQAIHEAGFEIPMAYKHMLVGVDLPPPSQEQTLHLRRSYTKRCGIAITPTRLPTNKEHGLPISNALKVGKLRTP